MIAAGLVLIAVGTWAAIHWRNEPTPPLRQLVLADGRSTLGVLSFVALHEGYFRDEGIDLQLVVYPTGRDALAAVSSGRADLATVAETPIATAVAAGVGRFRVIATIASYPREMVLLSRRGVVSSPEMLIGKRIGIAVRTTSEYFLDGFLLWHGIPREKVDVVTLPPDAFRTALSDGRVDAVSAWMAVAVVQSQALGEDAIIFTGEDFNSFTWNVVVAETMKEKDPDLARALIRALVRAETHVDKNPAVIQEMTARYFPELMDFQYDDTALFDVVLDQALILNLESQARWWRQRNNEPGPIPNFLDYLWLEPLLQEKPGAVGIIR